jgi:hypothetical protein
MPNEPLARAIPPSPEAPSEDDYRAFCAALSESSRGRALLAEYDRRNRVADTEMLLAAIERLEAHLRAEGSAVQRLRDDLRMLLIAIRIVRPEIEAIGPAAAKAAKLTALLELLERRIDAMAELKPAETAPAGAAHGPLAVVPTHDEPELPIPSTARFEPRPVDFGAGASPSPAVVDDAAAPATPPADPLAAIMALSEDERLALFT